MNRHTCWYGHARASRRRGAQAPRAHHRRCASLGLPGSQADASDAHPSRGRDLRGARRDRPRQLEALPAGMGDVLFQCVFTPRSQPKPGDSTWPMPSTPSRANSSGAPARVHGERRRLPRRPATRDDPHPAAVKSRGASSQRESPAAQEADSVGRAARYRRSCAPMKSAGGRRSWLRLVAARRHRRQDRRGSPRASGSADESPARAVKGPATCCSRSRTRQKMGIEPNRAARGERSSRVASRSWKANRSPGCSVHD